MFGFSDNIIINVLIDTNVLSLTSQIKIGGQRELKDCEPKH